MLQQAMIDMRALKKDAAASIDFPPEKCIRYTKATDPSLPAGNIWLVCADALLPIWAVPAANFLHMIQRGELSARCMALRSVMPGCWPYIIIMGTLTPTPLSKKTEIDGKSTDHSWRSTQGALLAAQELGVQVITIGWEAELGETLAWLVDRDRSIKRVKPIREALFMTPGELLLGSFEGMGDVRVEKALAHAGSNPAMALVALTDLSETIPGIPANVRAGVRQALGLPEDMRLGLDSLTQEVTV